MFEKDDYIVTLKISDAYSGVVSKNNYIVKCSEPDDALIVYLDLNHDPNGNNLLAFDKSDMLLDWRYATIEEINEYDKLGKPFDVTTLKFKLPEKWYLKGTQDNTYNFEKDPFCISLNKWAYEINNVNESRIGFLIDYYYYISNDKFDFSEIKPFEYIEITIEQFEKYVLFKKETIEDLSYLKDLLQSLNIV